MLTKMDAVGDDGQHIDVCGPLSVPLSPLACAQGKHMTMRIRVLAVLAVTVVASPAAARDTKAMYSIVDALATPAAIEKVRPSIKLFFGNTPAPKGQAIGTWRTNKKTNAFNKTDREACQWAFLSAVLELQQRAANEGGNAVVDIKSVYRNIQTVSDTQFMCGTGAMVAGVALEGTVIRRN